MCIGYEGANSRAGRLNGIGRIGLTCLALGLILQVLVHPEGRIANNGVHAVAGALLGFAMVVNLFRAYSKPRQKH
jgi:hypothetical protein